MKTPHICLGCTDFTGPHDEHVMARHAERVIARVPDYYEQYSKTSTPPTLGDEKDCRQKSRQRAWSLMFTKRVGRNMMMAAFFL
jgi:hypothetical protein